jgi:exo-beta-1,3-glucanase (GH17 family)
MRIHAYKPIILISFFTLLISSGCSSAQEPGSVVQILKTDSGYQMLKNGEPYTILGVGGTSRLEELKELGANTIRTWDAEGIEPLMDQAHELGLSVVVGIWLEHERNNFDYSDPESKAQQLDRVKQFVVQFRDHPALLAWGVGNEVEIGGSMDTAIQQINDASALIKELDQNHPTMAVIAEIGNDKAIRIQNECPNIDILGINSYAGMSSVVSRAVKQGYTGPIAITEFGPVGHWETGYTPWGAPYEQTSSSKASFIKKNYERSIQANLGKNCLGSFAFLWGHKQEKTSTWYGLHLSSGEMTESVDVLSELWTGKIPANQAPRVTKMNLDADPTSLAPGMSMNVSVDTSDPDGDVLDVEWSLVSESMVESMGGDFEESIEPVEISVIAQSSTNATLVLPQEPGAYRIFVIVRDGQGHAGTANTPIMIVE